MSKQFAVLHIKKGKGFGGGLGNHIDRVEGMEHTYPHSDPMRKELNQEFANERFAKLSIPQAVKLRIKEGYKKPTAIRKDAVRYLSTVLTGSPEQMQKINNDKTLFDKWIEENMQFAKDEFGEKNIVRFTLHLDEKTPHIHVVHVPITNEGGLSARQYIGNRKMLSQMQDRYAVAMEPFGLERGIKNTGIKHDTAKEYYRRIKMTENEVENLKVKGIFGVKKDETITLLQNTLKTQILQSDLEDKKKYQKLNQAKRDLKYMSHYRNSANEKLIATRKNLQETKKILNAVVKSPKVMENYKAFLAEKEAEKEAQIQAKKIRKKGRNRGRGI